jgi:DNA-binding transcriptional MerR regulator
VNELEWLAHAVHSGQLRLPYDDESYLAEEDLYDFARANGIDASRMHYMIEQCLLVPQRNGLRGRLYNACSMSDTMDFVDKMGEAGLSIELQQVIVQEMSGLEEMLWRETISHYRKTYPVAREGTLADARLRVAASVSVINTIHKERQWVLAGTTTDSSRQKQLERYLASSTAQKRVKAARLERLERLYGGS